MEQLPASASDLLCSWKEIATYLKRDVSTVRRWERTEGLPVHRQQHAARGTVYADPYELDRWFADRLRAGAVVAAEAASPAGNGTAVATEHDDAPLGATTETESTRWRSRQGWLLGSLVFVVLAAFCGAWLAVKPRREPALVLVATPDPTSEGGKRAQAALRLALARSGFQTVSDRRLDELLILARKPAGTPVDRSLAADLSARDNRITHIIAPSLVRMGDQWVVRLNLTIQGNVDYPIEAERTLASLNDLDAALWDLSDRAVPLIDRTRPVRLPEPLPAVTTSSTEALIAYAKAYALVNTAPDGNWEAALPLLREAVRYDPDFASAHAWLAWASLWVVESSSADADSEAQFARAYALAPTVSPAERLWIEGSYFFSRQDYQRARTAFAALVELQPDNFWAWENLGGTAMRLGDLRVAVNAFSHSTALRPAFLQSHVRLAQLLLHNGDVAAAENYQRKARGLLQGVRPHRARLLAWVDFFPALAAWRREDFSAAGRLINEIGDRLHEYTPPVRDEILPLIGQLYGALGQSARGDVVLRMSADADFHLPWAALVRFDRAALRRSIVEWSKDVASPLLFTRAGELDRARDALREWRAESVANQALREHRSIVARLAEADLAVAEGRGGDAIQLAREPIAAIKSGTYPYWLRARILAEAYSAGGHPVAAVEVLLEAVENRSRGIGPGGEFSGSHWTAALAQAAALEPERLVGAMTLRERLRRVLAMADADSPFRKLPHPVPSYPRRSVASLVTPDD